MIKTALTAASLALVATATPAFAGDKDAPSVTFSVADLDLTTPEGQARLEQRIDTVARTMCRIDETATGTRIKSSKAKRCYNDAVKSVERQVAAMVKQKERGG